MGEGKTYGHNNNIFTRTLSRTCCACAHASFCRRTTCHHGGTSLPSATGWYLAPLLAATSRIARALTPVPAFLPALSLHALYHYTHRTCAPAHYRKKITLTSFSASAHFLTRLSLHTAHARTFSLLMLVCSNKTTRGAPTRLVCRRTPLRRA